MEVLTACQKKEHNHLSPLRGRNQSWQCRPNKWWCVCLK